MTSTGFLADDTVNSHIAGWLRDLGSVRRLATKTLEAYRRDLGQFVTFLAGHTRGAVSLASQGDMRAAPIEIARQFVMANKGLRPDMMSVTCRRGQLQEVRICFAKDLRGFTPCPEVARQNCRAGEVSVEAAR